MRVFAHRGARITSPENTLESLQRARDEGADGIEFDVQLSADGEPFLFHDECARRVAGKPVVVGRLKWKELRELRVFGRHAVPHLEDALRAVEDWPKGELFIDLHQKRLDLSESVARRVKASSARARVAVLDFFTNRELLKRVVETEPEVQIAVMPGPPWWIERACAFGARSLCLGWDGALTRWLYRSACRFYNTRKAIRAAQKKGIPVSGGVANTAEEIGYLMRQGVDGIWTDDLILARRVLSEGSWR